LQEATGTLNIFWSSSKRGRLLAKRRKHSDFEWWSSKWM